MADSMTEGDEIGRCIFYNDSLIKC